MREGSVPDPGCGGSPFYLPLGPQDPEDPMVLEVSEQVRVLFGDVGSLF